MNCPRCGATLPVGTRACGACGAAIPRFFMDEESLVRDLAYMDEQGETRLSGALERDTVAGIFRALADDLRAGLLDASGFRDRLERMRAFLERHGDEMVRFMERVRRWAEGHEAGLSDHARGYEERVRGHLAQVQCHFDAAFEKARRYADSRDEEALASTLRSVDRAMDAVAAVDEENTAAAEVLK